MDNFLLKWNAFIEVLITYEGYKDVKTGLYNTFIISILGLVIGILIGTLLATIKVTPRYRMGVRIAQKIADGYIAIFRGTPIVVQLLVFYYVLFPLLGWKITSVQSCIIIFGFNSGAYISEIMRSGIQSVDPGQTEAGRALGLSYPMTMIKIVIPQAIKNILPTLGNEFIALIKETSVVSFVGAMDLSQAFRKIAGSTYEFIIPYLVMALIYIVIVAAITVLIRIMERRLARSDRNRQSNKKIRKPHGA